MHKSRQAIEEWKKAEEAARAAETRLKEAWDAYDQRQGKAPGAELMEEVSQLRAVANDKLRVAMLLTAPDGKPSP